MKALSVRAKILTAFTVVSLICTLGISFLALTETAGMGMRAKEESFLEQFSGKMIGAGQMLGYTKSGAPADNEIDAISGCTITTSAVTKDVNAALTAVRTVLEQEE